MLTTNTDNIIQLTKRETTTNILIFSATLKIQSSHFGLINSGEFDEMYADEMNDTGTF